MIRGISIRGFSHLLTRQNVAAFAIVALAVGTCALRLLRRGDSKIEPRMIWEVEVMDSGQHISPVLCDVKIILNNGKQADAILSGLDIYVLLRAAPDKFKFFRRSLLTNEKVGVPWEDPTVGAPSFQKYGNRAQINGLPVHYSTPEEILARCFRKLTPWEYLQMSGRTLYRKTSWLRKTLIGN